jgi:ABC-type amino acid transport substrate-binding protein
MSGRRTTRRDTWPGLWPAVAVVILLLAVGAWLLVRTLIEPVDETWERILETGVLRVCTDPSWPPFEYIRPGSGQVDGFDIELAGLLAERLAPGLRVQVVSVGFDGLYDALLTGRCDAVLSALPYDPLRTEDVIFSVAYFNAGQVLLTRSDMAGIEVLDDLVGRVVGVEWGFVPQGDSRQRDLLRNLPARRYDTPGDALRALHAGEVEAAIVDRISALSYTRECEGLVFVGEPIHDVNYIIPVRSDSFLLLQAIDEALLEMREDGTMEALQERWF